VILTALALFCCTTISSDAGRTPAPPTAFETKPEPTPNTAGDAGSSKPDAPTPKTLVSATAKPDLGLSGEASEPAVQPSKAPVKSAIAESYETPRQKKIWYALMVLDHGTAAFDAWTTRRAVSGGYGVEGDPFQRPFAHSGAIYATTQVTPVVMDFLARYMMKSSHPMIRKAWWVPQAASASVSLGAGVHNYTVVP
jgi:hypothetical protein